MSPENVLHTDRSIRWWRRSAPPRIGWPLAAAYGLLLVAAISDAAWEWPRGIGLALLIPGLAVHMGLSMAAGQAHDNRFRQQMPPLRLRLVLGGAVGLMVLLAGSVRPAYYAPLLVVAFLILVLDPLTRVIWRATDQR
jgi:hypothetical protein